MKNNKISVFKDLFKSTDVPFNLTLEQVVQRIKKGTSKEKIEQIRNGKKEVKKKLPSIIFSGEYSERNRKGLKKHSGLMVLDFDKYPSTKTLHEHLELLKSNKHFVLLFISPSGNGIKGVVRVPDTLDEITHPQYFKAFQKQFKYEYFDISNSNVDRVCFESYDPNIYVNYEAELFEAKVVDEGFSYAAKPPTIKIESDDKVIARVMKFDWQKSFVRWSDE